MNKYKPIDRLDAIWNIILNDEEIKKLNVLSDKILQSKDIPVDWNKGDKYILIHRKSDEDTINPDMLMEVYEIDVVVDNELVEIRKARIIEQRIIKLLSKKPIFDNRICKVLNGLGSQTTSLNKIYQIGRQFGFYVVRP